VLAEAMAVGLPVVTTEVSAIPELVEDGITGRLVPPGEPAAMAEAIREVLLQQEEPLRRAEQARKRVEAHFDNRQCVKQLHALFQKALTGP
jgi:glycosyltransferase involved in cell wall biosynthesis